MLDGGTARPAVARRVVDLAIIAGAAATASTAIALWHDRPLTMVVTCAAVLVALLVRHHEPRDLVGLVVGATVGNAVELACDATGIWQHADRAVLGLAPAYILLCYPILGLATPRMADALAGTDRSRHEVIGPVAPIAAGLLLMFVVLSMQFGRDAGMQSLVCAVCLALTLWRFHSRHDLVTALAGAVIALAWEVPATIAGAWQFPKPQVFGLLPAWLPAAYAVFFVTVGRLTAALVGRLSATLRAPAPNTQPQAPTLHSQARATVAWLTPQTLDSSKSPAGPATARRRGQIRHRPSAQSAIAGTAPVQTRPHQARTGLR